ncbi:polysaccharide deacetylase family protein [Brassicibacter mesophilus]|uniref:polysaccharide deacetylase family protein n=1 Tax=Brassicibacter mesophilus TaxID=745119 RepID=UPI003D249F7C
MQKKVCLKLLFFLLFLFITFSDLIIFQRTVNDDTDAHIVTEDGYIQLVKQGPNNKKVIALTFDDGPHPRITPQILSILKENDIKATFFVLGKHTESYPETLKMVADEGHEIGNHTYSHVDVSKISKDRVEHEIEGTQKIINEVTGRQSELIRPPFGFYNENLLNIASKNNLTIVLWSPHQDSNDWSNPGVRNIIKSILSNIENGDIILLHDYVEGKSHTVEALKTVIPELKNRGYEFVTVSELIELFNEK